MATKKLNNTLVSNLPVKGEPYEIRDTDVKGLLVRVEPLGTKTFKVNYARGKTIKIGNADSMTVSTARRIAREKKVEAASGQDPIESRRINKAGTFTEFFRNHYESHIKENQKGARQALNRYKNLCTWLGKVPLSELTPFRITKFQSQRKKEGISNTTINRDVSAIQSMLEYAVKSGFLTEHPFKGKIKRYKEGANNPRFLSPEEETRLRETLQDRDSKKREDRKHANSWRAERSYESLPEIGLYSDHLTPLVITAMLTGLRRGELFNLVWQDVDLRAKTLQVKAGGAKSGKTRTVPLPAECLKVLTEWKQITDFSQPGEIVFPNKKGERLDNVNTSFRNLLKAAGITDFRFHDIRHHYASMLVQEGVQLYTVKELLGHSDFKMTQRYAHLAPDNLAEAVRALNNRRTRETEKLDAQNEVAV